MISTAPDDAVMNFPFSDEHLAFLETFNIQAADMAAEAIRAYRTHAPICMPIWFCPIGRGAYELGERGG